MKEWIDAAKELVLGLAIISLPALLILGAIVSMFYGPPVCRPWDMGC